MCKETKAIAYLTLKDINKIYPNGYHAVHNFNLETDKGEFIVFVGPSGCGKSTMLRMIAGLEDISNGEFLINGKRAIKLGKAEDAYHVQAQVELTEMLGDNTNVYITTGEEKAILKVDPHDTPEIDSTITFSIPFADVYLFDGETENVIDRVLEKSKK